MTLKLRKILVCLLCIASTHASAEESRKKSGQDDNRGTDRNLLTINISKEKFDLLTEKLPEKSRRELLEYAKASECASYAYAYEQCSVELKQCQSSCLQDSKGRTTKPKAN